MPNHPSSVIAGLWTIMVLHCLIWSSCTTPVLITAWKGENAMLPIAKENRIAVIFITKDPGISLRGRIEQGIAAKLNGLGYRTVSYVQLYGIEGLSPGSGEATYRRLSASGIDALVIVALIDKSKETEDRPGKSSPYSPGFYYERVTAYRRIGVDVSAPAMDAAALAYWEVLLFDLHTLTPTAVLRTGSYYTLSAIDLSEELPGLVVQQLQKEKVVGNSRRNR